MNASREPTPPLEAEGEPARPVAPAESSGVGERALTALELKAARLVFSAGIDYARVRVARLPPFIAAINGNRAFVLGNAVHAPAGIYEDFPAGRNLFILVHELTHVWQFQHHGWGYLPDALWAQLFGEGYDYAKALRENKPWEK